MPVEAPPSGLAALWRSRGLILGAAAVATALHAQQLISVDSDVRGAIRWYVAAILLMLVAWWGTYRPKQFRMLPFGRGAAATPAAAEGAPGTKRPGWMARHPRITLTARCVLAFAALGLGVYSTLQLRRDYNSPIGGIGWALSLILLVVAFIGDRPPRGRDADARAQDVEDRTAWHLPIRWEVLIVLGIFVLALALRVYHVDDWTFGMHGDEGEAGMDALAIYQGHLVSPFLSGWFGQLNFYYWGIALLMHVFGTGLGGVRAFALIVGTITVVPFYLLVRDWFGTRTAIIAAVLLAVSDVDIAFSREELSTITTPLFLVVGFLCLFRGMRTRRPLYFVLAGYAFMLNPYFYFGGRIAPILLGGALAFLFVAAPVLRLPGDYRALRRRMPDLARLRAVGEALRTEIRGLLFYGRHLVVLAIACVICAGPWFVYSTDHAAEWNSRPLEKLVFNNAGRMAQQYGATHDPLYVGLRMPQPSDVYPFLPVVFEHTSLSVQVARDGFWPRVLWGQLTTTLSILTYRGDASSFYTFAEAPAAKPIEAALIILGLAWAVWRWRDSRMAMLLIWFWGIVLSGGVLTIDAPYMPRILGIVPAIALFAALPLSKLSAEFIYAVSLFGRRIRLARMGQAFTAVALIALLAGLGVQNYNDYYNHYVLNHPFQEVTGQAEFVREMNAKAASAGDPQPRFYDLGMHMIYWGHGVNRFLNAGTDGSDMINPANELPVLDDQNRDVYFMVWSLNQQYLDVLRAYYPQGTVEPFNFGPPGHQTPLFTAFHVSKAALAAQRVLRATYTPATGPAIMRDEPSLGTGNAPPSGLAYPLQATWSGGLVAPAFSTYRFQLTGTAAARLVVDGTPVLTGTGTTANASRTIVLARGVHDVTLTATLPTAETRVGVSWAVSGAAIAPVRATYLWSGPGKSFLGEVRRLSGDPFGPLPPDKPNSATPTVIMRRIDGFLGFRHAPDALSNGAPLLAAWTGTVTTTQAGIYQFDAYANGGMTLAVDGQLVLDARQTNGAPANVHGQIALAPGAHQIEVRYVWRGGTGYLEVYWTPPGGARTMLGTQAMHTPGGAWAVGSVSPPGNVSVQLGKPPVAVRPTSVLAADKGLLEPRGVTVGPNGDVYIGDTGNNRIVHLDAHGNAQPDWGSAKTPGFAELGDLAVTPQGQIIALDSKTGDLQFFQPDGTLVRRLPAVAPQGNGIAVGPDGRIYIAHTGGNRVLVLQPDGSNPRALTGGADGTRGRFDQPVDVAVAPDGTVYAIDLKERIVRLDAAGQVVQEWPVQIGVARGGSRLTVWQGQVVMSDPDRARLVVLDPASGEERLVGGQGTDPGQFQLPLGIATGPDGQLYVVDSDNRRVQVFNRELLAP